MSNESLSALFDGECDDAELDRLLGELERKPEMAQRWSRWQLRRDLQEGTRVAAGQRCICADVMAQLEEPVKHGNVVDLSAWRRRLGVLPWKTAAGLAAAASMGAAAVLFVGNPEQAQDGPGSASAEQSFSPAVKVGSPLSLPIGSSGSGRLQSVSFSGDPSAAGAPTFADEEYAELLREYVVNHNNLLSDSGVGGTLRYARFASHSVDYRAQLAAEPEGQR